MNWLKRLFSVFRRNKRNMDPAMGRRLWNMFGMGPFRARTDADWAQLFGDNARLRAPLHAIAEDVAAVPWHLYRKSKTGKKKRVEVVDHRLLDLLRCPHPMMPWATWCYVVQLYLDLVGKCPIRITYQGKTPVRLTPFPPHWICQLPNANDKFFHVNWWGSGEVEKIPASEVLWLYRPDPMNPFGDGLGIARGLDDEVSQDEAMSKFNNYYFRNSTFLGLLVNAPGADVDELADKFRAERDGVMNAFKTFFMNSEGLSVTNLSPKLRELNFQDGRKQTRDFIREGIGVAGPRIGVRGDNAVRGNDDASDFHQQSKMVKPRLLYLQQAFNLWLVPLFGDSTIFLEAEDPVRESQEEMRLRVELGMRLGIMTVNEAREKVGLDPLDHGDVLSVPVNNVVLIPSTADLAMAAQSAVQAMNQSGGDPGNQIAAKTA